MERRLSNLASPPTSESAGQCNSSRWSRCRNPRRAAGCRCASPASLHPRTPSEAMSSCLPRHGCCRCCTAATARRGAPRSASAATPIRCPRERSPRPAAPAAGCKRARRPPSARQSASPHPGSRRCCQSTQQCGRRRSCCADPRRSPLERARCPCRCRGTARAGASARRRARSCSRRRQRSRRRRAGGRPPAAQTKPSCPANGTCLQTRTRGSRRSPRPATARPSATRAPGARPRTPHRRAGRGAAAGLRRRWPSASPRRRSSQHQRPPST
mmetsp:Transcript_17205/g.60053  ORF Transcript_17205/g.60053 Transcript_17205/m.60053 type:complete len:271 (-) Transcript_17205:2783-3595(-)